MKNFTRVALAASVLSAALLPVAGCSSDGSNSSSQTSNTNTALAADARSAYAQLLNNDAGAAALAKSAKAVLVFPRIIKGGFIIGGFTGDGALMKNGEVTGYYNTSGGSYGLQAGAQQYGFALFFMKESDLTYLDKSEGWEVGVGPTVTVVDKGISSSFTTTTAQEGVFCFFFDQKGLMAGLGVQGSKITRITK